MITTVSITDLKQNTASVIKRVTSEGKPIVIMQRSKAAAVLVDPEYYNNLQQALEDAEDIKAIEDRKNEPTVSLGAYLKRRFSKKF